MTKIYVGTRGSELALWQAHQAIAQLKKHDPTIECEIKIYTSKGDTEDQKPLPKFEGKGVFTQALDQGLLNNEIDLAVHSHKDLPIAIEGPIVTAAVLEREQAHDVVISKHKIRLIDLPEGAIIGTSSTRRASQIRAMGRSLVAENIRGNVPTRIDKVLDLHSIYDATLLAYAGVKRLKLLAHISEVLDFDQMLPAPAQGSIALQCLRATPIFSLCCLVDHAQSRWATEAERGFLYGLGGGCSMPIAALAICEDGQLKMRGKVISLDGENSISLNDALALHPSFSFEEAFSFGLSMARQALKRGAKNLLLAGDE